MIINENGYNKVQINYTEDRTADGQIIKKGLMINIRNETVEEAYRLYESLRERIEGKVKSKNKKEKKSEIPACPKCNSPMILRQNSKKGNWFHGCTAFPLCDGTRQYKIKKEVPADENLIMIEAK